MVKYYKSVLFVVHLIDMIKSLGLVSCLNPYESLMQTGRENYSQFIAESRNPNRVIV